MSISKVEHNHFYDLLAPESLFNPYPLYAQLREQEPVYFYEPGDFWLLTRYKDVEAGFIDPRLSSKKEDSYVKLLGDLSPDIIRNYLKLIENFLIDLDPPKHTEMRRLAMSGFTNSALSSWQPIIQETTNSFLDKVQDKGSMDIVSDLSAQLPSTVISNIFGVPESLRSKFIQWVTDIATFAGSPSSENIEEIARNADTGAASFTALIEELMSERRSNPKADMISLLVKAYEEEKRNTEEIPALCVLILLAGHVTSVDLIPNGVNALLNHPEQLLLLKENPELIGSAVEEMIRYDTPGQIAFRLATEDIIIDTKKIPSGSMVGLCMAAANHDPEKFKAPHEFNIKRSNNEHLGFAKGIHFCLGIILARMELAICFNTLLKRMPLISFDLSRPPVRKRDSIVFSGFESLYVNF